jgi:hypothetical protein
VVTFGGGGSVVGRSEPEGCFHMALEKGARLSRERLRSTSFIIRQHLYLRDPFASFSKSDRKAASAFFPANCAADSDW